MSNNYKNVDLYAISDEWTADQDAIRSDRQSAKFTATMIKGEMLLVAGLAGSAILFLCCINPNIDGIATNFISEIMQRLSIFRYLVASLPLELAINIYCKKKKAVRKLPIIAWLSLIFLRSLMFCFIEARAYFNMNRANKHKKAVHYER